MSRTTLGGPARVASSASIVYVGELVDIAFPSGTIRLTSGSRPVTFNANVYSVTAIPVAVGNGFTEAKDGKARRLSLSLSGVDPTLKTKIMTDAYSFAKVNAYLAFFDANWALVTTYQLVTNRLLSNVVVTLSSESADMDLTCEAPQVMDGRDSAVLASPETQRLRYIGDTGMDRVAKIAGMQIEWGGFTEAVLNRGGWVGKGRELANT